MRLLSGLLAAQPFDSVLAGDESLSRRPMNRVIEPLSRMGARIDAQDGGLPPLRIRGGRKLQGVAFESPEIGRAHVSTQSLMRISYAVFCLQKKNCYTQLYTKTDYQIISILDSTL